MLGGIGTNVSLMPEFNEVLGFTAAEVRDGMPRLAIPNQTVRRLMYGYLRDGYRDVGVFAVSSTAKR